MAIVDREVQAAQSAALAASARGGETLLKQVQAGELTVDQGLNAALSLLQSLSGFVDRARRNAKAKTAPEAPGL